MIPAEVRAAFGLRGEPVALPGGKGGTWRVGPVVLKPVEYLPETRWRAEVLAALPDSAEFRTARPVRALDGDWVAHGWEAAALVDGAVDVGRPDEVLRAGRAFHAAIAHLPRPAFLDTRDDPWTHGDRVAWQELPAPDLDLLAPLLAARRPVTGPAQVVHGDLAGNVLFAPGLAPALIDWPVYWRPAGWAAAVAVVDALCWYGAGPDLADRWAHLPDWGQQLTRALIYRIVTDDTARAGVWTAERRAAYRPAVAVALRYA